MTTSGATGKSLLLISQRHLLKVKPPTLLSLLFVRFDSNRVLDLIAHMALVSAKH
jgi:hypothetical protein